MCGIVGTLNLREGMAPPPLDAVTRGVAALRHRGPDEFGLYRDDQVALGHARLSIIDLATGQQPLANEDGSLWIVFNGEIYNHVELRSELEGLGHRFRTRSDTEVIVHAWEAWGRESLVRLNGQFAFALWNAPRGELVLARDRFGVRPLYLCEHQGRLWFASEVRALFTADPSIPRALDPAGLAETFTFWTVVPPQSVFRGVSELEPGHLRVQGRTGGQVRPFWTPHFPMERSEEFRGSAADAAERVRSALQGAVDLRMLRSDVPVGSYLSGGLDSSLVASMGRRSSPGRFHTFSVRFEDAEWDETPFQRAVASRIGSDHHEIVVRRRDILDVFPDVVAHAERPLLRSAPAPLFLLSRLVRERGIKVVLTGEGADEMFAGYDLFREAKVRRFWGREPASTLRPRLLERLYPYLSRSPVAPRTLAQEFFGRDRSEHAAAGFGHRPRWRGAATLRRLLSSGMRDAFDTADVATRLLQALPEEFPRWSPLAQDQYLEVRTLLSGYLLASQGDRMAMAHSVEGRFPFLDPHVVDLANALPPRFKLRGLDEKHVLKKAAVGLVPPEVLARRKQPYRAPDALAFADRDPTGWVAEVLDERAVRDAGVFDPDGVGLLWRKCRAASSRGQPSHADDTALLAVLSVGLLHEHFVRKPPGPFPPVRLATLIDRTVPRSTRPHVDTESRSSA